MGWRPASGGIGYMVIGLVPRTVGYTNMLCVLYIARRELYTGLRWLCSNNCTATTHRHELDFVT